LARRYTLLVVSHLSPADRLAAGLRVPPALSQPFAATQAAWRFYANTRVRLPMLVGPLIELVRQEVPVCCRGYVLVVLDWSNLHFESHTGKSDRTRLRHGNNRGYKLLSALAIGDIDGVPLAPVCVELIAKDGVHSSRSLQTLAATSSLDSLTPVMEHVAGLGLGQPPVFIIDAEADSVAHYRQWHKAGRWFVVRADAAPKVQALGQNLSLGTVADRIAGTLRLTGEVLYKGRQLRQYVGQTPVTLTRAARPHRVTQGRRRQNLPGEPLTLRLVVSELRDDFGQMETRWLLLTNLPATVDAATVATWYLWRWRIEDCHKQLKGAGQQVEDWQQESAEALAKRLCVALMSLALVWRLARDESTEGANLREVLVRLSGRQIKRGKGRRTFTESALLAGLGVLMPMLALLQDTSPAQLLKLIHAALPLWPPGRHESG
jgi:hypothetical protein